MKGKQIGARAAITTITMTLLIVVIVGFVYVNSPINNLSSNDAARASLHRTKNG